MNETVPRLHELARIYLRSPASLTEDASGRPVAVFDPPLTAQEQVVWDRLVRYASFLGVQITLEEWALLEPFLTTGRGFLGMSQSEFIALGQNQRDRMLFDNVTALWRVVFRLLRD